MTSVVVYLQNPSWNDDFMFDLEDHHHYLNVAVWLTLREGKGNLLLGHVRENSPVCVCVCVLVCVG